MGGLNEIGGKGYFITPTIIDNLPQDSRLVWVNSQMELRPDVPFEGHEWSGIGSKWGSLGVEAIGVIHRLYGCQNWPSDYVEMWMDVRG